MQDGKRIDSASPNSVNGILCKGTTSSGFEDLDHEQCWVPLSHPIVGEVLM